MQHLWPTGVGVTDALEAHRDRLVRQVDAALRQGDPLQPLADYTIARHYPELVGAEDSYLRFFEAVVDRQAALVARLPLQAALIWWVWRSAVRR